MSVKFSIEDAKFSPYLQDSIIYLLMTDPDFLKRCYHVVKPSVFSDERKIICKICYDYHSEYSDAPGEYILDIIEDTLSRKPTKRKMVLKYLDRIWDLEPNKYYVLNTFGGFIKEKICADSISKADGLNKKGKIKEAEETILEGFREAYSVTGETVIDYMVHGHKAAVEGGGFQELNFKTFIDPYDRMCGGYYRKEFVLYFGDSSVGKSFRCVYDGKIALLQGKKVLHITLETAKEIIWERYVASFTASFSSEKGGEHQIGDTIKRGGKKIKLKKLSMKKLKQKLDFLKRKRGKLWLHQATNFTYNDLISLLNNLEIMHGEIPDVIIIDSPDQMVLSKKSNQEIRLVEKDLYQRILDLGKDRNATVIATTQAGKQVAKKRLARGEDISENYWKFRIPDTRISLNQTEEEYKRGLLRMYLAGARGSSKHLLVELVQCLEIGQFVLDAKICREDLAMREAKKIKESLGLE